MRQGFCLLSPTHDCPGFATPKRSQGRNQHALYFSGGLMGEEKVSIMGHDRGDEVLAALDSRVRRIAQEVVREASPPARALESDVLDAETRREIQEQILIARKTYLTRAEAAKYLQVSEKSIGEWSKRPPDENPLPAAYAGADPRFKRTALDEWAAREAGRRLAG